MAKLTGPLMSLSASGQFASTIVYATWKGIKYARAYVIPENPNTSAQQVIRGYFSTAVAAWQGETSPHRLLWTDYASTNGLQESGFNLYVGKYCTFLGDNAGTPPTGTITPPNMT